MKRLLGACLFVALLGSLTSCRTASLSAVPNAEMAKAPTAITPFSRHAEFGQVKISPDGKYLAATKISEGKRALAFIDLQSMKFTFLLRPAGRSMVGNFYWVNNERVVVSLVQQHGYLATPINYGELYAVNADGAHGRIIFGYRAGEMQTGTHLKKGRRDFAWAEVVDVLPAEPRHILIKSTPMKGSGEKKPSAYKLEVYKGTKTLKAICPVVEGEFVTDEKGELRAVVSSDEENQTKVYLRNPEDRTWRELKTAEGFPPRTRPISFSARDQSMMVLAPGADGLEGLYRLNMETGQRTELFQSEVVEPHAVVTDPVTGQLVAVEHHPDYPAYAFVDEEHYLAKMLKSLLASFPNQHVHIDSLTAKGDRAVVLVYSDQNPGEFYLVDTQSLSAQHLLARRKWIKAEQMASVKPFKIQASDGLTLYGYLTLPPGTETSGLPMVVMPHGGPHGVRDYWGFDQEAQLLASQGFAVLQVNFRGSGGYGQNFLEAGYRHWGDRVQQDIIEATRFAIAQKIADPERVCIYGASFGAYSALQSAILAPDLFRCAVGYAGIYDLALMHREGDIQDNKSGRAYLRRSLGQDETELREKSPVYQAQRIQVPVLLIHGQQDERAPIEHAEALKNALAKLGRAHQWLVKSNEAHGFYDESNREEMYTTLLSFISDHTRIRK